MGTLWFLSHPKENQDVAMLLEGNFAVRKVASIDSLTKLLRMQLSRPPSVFIYDASFDSKELWNTLKTYCQHSGKIMLSEASSSFGDALTVAKHDLGLLAAVGDLICAHSFLGYRDIEVDPKKSLFRIEGMQTWESLSKRELALLECFMDHTQSFLTIEDIQDKVWTGDAVSKSTIASQISRLRKKLEDSEAVIESSYGEGYRLS